jgi:hypothetical protein
MYAGRREFRLGRGWTLLFAGVTALFAAATYGAYSYRGWNWISIGMAIATVILGPGSIIESLVQRIELTDEAMIVRTLGGTRRYPIESIERIEESRGVPPALRLKDGRWVKLPSVATSLGNSVRAWLDR